MHWTQTPKGREIMSKRAKKSHAVRRRNHKSSEPTVAYSFVTTDPKTITFHARRHGAKDTLCGLLKRPVATIFQLKLIRVPSRKLTELSFMLPCTRCGKELVALSK